MGHMKPSATGKSRLRPSYRCCWQAGQQRLSVGVASGAAGVGVRGGSPSTGAVPPTSRCWSSAAVTQGGALDRPSRRWTARATSVVRVRGGSARRRVLCGLGLGGRVGVRRRRRVRPPTLSGQLRTVGRREWWCGVGVPPGAGFGQSHRGARVGIRRDGQQGRLDAGGWPAAGEGEPEGGVEGAGCPDPAPKRPRRRRMIRQHRDRDTAGTALTRCAAPHPSRPTPDGAAPLAATRPARIREP